MNLTAVESIEPDRDLPGFVSSNDLVCVNQAETQALSEWDSKYGIAHVL